MYHELKIFFTFNYHKNNLQTITIQNRIPHLNPISHHHRKLPSPQPAHFFTFPPVVPDRHCRCAAPFPAPAGEMMGLSDSWRTMGALVGIEAATAAASASGAWTTPSRLASMSMYTRGLLYAVE